MRRIWFGLAAMVTMALVTSVAQAQTYDHTKCFKIRDSANFAALVRLDAFQTEYNNPPAVIDGCTVAGKAKLFCVPVTKKVAAFKDKTIPPLAPGTLIGQNLKFDQLCYRVRCPRPSITTQGVQDQFGARDITGFVPTLLCTPAVKTTTPAPTCQQSLYPQCGGTCVNTTDACRPKSDGTPGCDCFPVNPPCDLTGPQCGGACQNPAQSCIKTATGGCYCGSVDVLCEQSNAPQCGGQCPSNLACAQNAADGTCQCVDVACGQATAPQCGGVCPVGANCRELLVVPGGCACQ